MLLLYRRNAAIGTDWNLVFWDNSLYYISIDSDCSKMWNDFDKHILYLLRFFFDLERYIFVNIKKSWMLFFLFRDPTLLEDGLMEEAQQDLNPGITFLTKYFKNKYIWFIFILKNPFHVKRGEDFKSKCLTEPNGMQ